MSEPGEKKRRRLKKGPQSPPSRLDDAVEPREIDPADVERKYPDDSPSRDPGNSRTTEVDREQTLVWRAVLFGAAVALVLIMIPSYLAVPRLGRTDLMAIGTPPDGRPQLVATLDLPPYSAGVASGRTGGHALVAVPGQNRIDVFELVHDPPIATDNSGAASPSSAGAIFVPRGSISIEGGPVVITTSMTRGVALVIDNSTSDVRVVDLASNEVTRSIAAGRRPVAAAVSDELAVAAVANLEGASVTLIDLASYTTRDVAVGERPRHLAVGGSYLFVAAEKQRQLEVVDLLSATKRDPIPLDFSVGSVAACRGWVVASDSQGNRAAVIDPTDPGRADYFDPGGRPTVLACLSTGQVAVGTDSPPGVSLFAIPPDLEGGSPTPQPLGSVPTSASPAFMAEISPGIVATTGPSPPSTLFSVGLMVANLFAVLVGGFVTGILARKRYGTHALVVGGVLLASYWVVFQGAQPAILPVVVIFIGAPVLATAASGALLSKLAIERLGLFVRTPQGKGETELK